MTRVATTFRLEPAIQAHLLLLSDLQGRSQNQMVNEALRVYLERLSRVATVDLSDTLERLRVFQESDPTGEASMRAAMQSEAALEYDPAEGVTMEQFEVAGPVSARVLEILGG